MGLIEKEEKGQLGNFNDPTMAKLKRMKLLKNSKLFDDVVDNGNDKVLEDKENFIKTTASTKKIDESKIPSGMDKDEFKKLVGRGIYDVIELLHEKEKEFKEHKENIQKKIDAATQQRLDLDAERDKVKKEREKRIAAEEQLAKLQNLVTMKVDNTKGGKTGDASSPADTLM